ncbi:type II toxin-antitoxin system Phd/YefM family antitoxin [Succinimonas sp.]|uniref:type II toxin-antitoxin system Phd/YefM family antitoxin n=1 Tax=Succinimonas sp. TaxID=1936151 RepID=UPI003862DBEB
MIQVGVREAKADLSKLIRLVESKIEDEVQIARNGKPVVKLVLIRPTPASKRIGVAEGKFVVPEDLDAGSDEIIESLVEGDLF